MYSPSIRGMDLYLLKYPGCRSRSICFKNRANICAAIICARVGGFLCLSYHKKGNALFISDNSRFISSPSRQVVQLQLLCPHAGHFPQSEISAPQLAQNPSLMVCLGGIFFQPEIYTGFGVMISPLPPLKLFVSAGYSVIHPFAGPELAVPAFGVAVIVPRK